LTIRAQSVPFRTYFLGSAIGLVGPLCLIVIFSEQAMAWLGYELPDDSSAVAALAGGSTLAASGGLGWALRNIVLLAGSVAQQAATQTVAS
jgi:hypothetical protein